MTNIVHLMVKDLRLLVRDRFGLFWIFVFPLVYALFFGAIFSGQSGGGGGGKIGIAVVDQDETPSSKQFVELLAKHPSLSVRRNENGSPRTMPLGRMSIDPAIAGGVVLTTVTDIVGYVSFLALGNWLLLNQ